MKNTVDLFEVLQVSPNAEPEVIEAAYPRLQGAARQLARLSLESFGQGLRCFRT